uniref:Tli4_C domain-containing protein n=1 Tax=Haemonchus contortus TaxID=6289 RepID=A0A7I4Y571_HAECO
MLRESGIGTQRQDEDINIRIRTQANCLDYENDEFYLTIGLDKELPGEELAPQQRLLLANMTEAIQKIKNEAEEPAVGAVPCRKGRAQTKDGGNWSPGSLEKRFNRPRAAP